MGKLKDTVVSKGQKSKVRQGSKSITRFDIVAIEHKSTQADEVAQGPKRRDAIPAQVKFPHQR